MKKFESIRKDMQQMVKDIDRIKDENENKPYSERINTRELEQALKVVFNNMRLAWYSENIDKIKSIYSKYVGKAYGEKTKAKLYQEIKEVCHCSIYISNIYYGLKATELAITPLNEKGYTLDYFCNIKLHIRKLILDSTNHLQELPTADQMTINSIGYIAKPLEYVQRLLKKKAQIKKKLEALQNDCKEFNDLIIEDMERIDYYDFHNFKDWTL